MAVSRRANTSGLEQLMEQGLENERGRVLVNEKMETNLPGIYAIGDLVHGAGLAHVASEEGEVAADNAMGHAAKMDYRVVPNPVYTFPEISFVGLTEAKAKEEHGEVRVERFPWAANGKAVGSAHSEGFTKVILGKYNEIVGAHIIGPDATNLITEYSLAMRNELTGDEIIGTKLLGRSTRIPPSVRGCARQSWQRRGVRFIFRQSSQHGQDSTQEYPAKGGG